MNVLLDDYCINYLLECLPIMLALCSTLSGTCYVQELLAILVSNYVLTSTDFTMSLTITELCIATVGLINSMAS